MDESIALTSGKLTRAQRNAMISTYPGNCSRCGGQTRLIKAVGSPWQWHRCGAPGDFGYETPVGDALSRLYRGES
ncbi:MAG TPA: hypothetical protein VJN18_32490 [Polyangiaceae bacterium]|nr:hypothetical protein [Polyangiaceae bacterium]